MRSARLLGGNDDTGRPPSWGQKGHAGVCRGHDCRVDLVPELKLALVLFDNPGGYYYREGSDNEQNRRWKRFFFPVDEAIRVWNEERGVAALWPRIASPGGK